MTGPGIYSYSTTPANNVNANTGINWDEGMSPSAVNNSARQNMTDMRNAFNDLIWFKYGKGDLDYSPVYASSTTFTVAGIDVTAVYHAGRRVKAVGSSTGTIYGTISSSAFSTNTTVTVAWDSGSLSNESLTIYLSQVPITGYPVGASRPTTFQLLTSGSSATYNTPAGCKQLRILAVGGGGGGAGSSGTGLVAGSNGGDTSFNSVTAAQGNGAPADTTNFAGGATSGNGSGSPTNILRFASSKGGRGNNGQNVSNIPGGTGSSAAWIGAGGGAGGNLSAGDDAIANSGGGGGGGDDNTAGTIAGGGGSAGESITFTINSPSATYTYTVGAGGAGGSSTKSGGRGAAGIIIVEEFY